MLHDSGDRSGRLVALNCAAIPADLLEAELFGIDKGVATGVRARIGKFQEAQRGTSFLDEIGDLPPILQAKLLRVLQEGVVQPLGGEPKSLDVRIISATHAPLKERIAQGTFRSDLYFRLAGFELSLPPLRERLEDIPGLIQHFAEKACGQTDKRIRGFSVDAFKRMRFYSWPGNIRQLEHEVQRALLQCPPDDVITTDLLSDDLRFAPLPDPGASAVSADLSTEIEPQLRALERRLILEALRATHGNQTRAAQRLGISRNGLLHRIKKLDITPDAYR